MSIFAWVGNRFHLLILELTLNSIGVFNFIRSQLKKLLLYLFSYDKKTTFTDPVFWNNFHISFANTIISNIIIRNI